MHFRSLFVASLFLLAGCCGDKYPYPPQFVAPADLRADVLGAPPAKGSATFEQEIRYIVKRQQHLSAAEKEAIVTENKIAPEMMIYPVLGEQYTRENFPALYALATHAASDSWRIADVNQDYWKSPRPWYADSRVQLIAPKIESYGYPSGHTTTNHVWAQVLGDVFPAKRKDFTARADAIANHRMDGGVHFPHDLAAGRRLARIMYTKMKQTPAYQQELAAAKRELKASK